FVSLPLMAVATLDAARPRAARIGGISADRRWAIRAAGAAFCLVLALQSLSWAGLSARLEGSVVGQAAACVSPAAITWLRDTPLDHWSTPYYAIILQGRAPHRLLLPEDHCAALARSGHLELNDLGEGRPPGAWFDFSQVVAGSGPLAGRRGAACCS